MIPLPTLTPLAVRALVALAVASAGFLVGWTVNGWRLGTQVARVEAREADTVRKATAAALAQLKEARAEYDALAVRLSNVDRDALAEIARLQHENDSLRVDVRGGRRVVRVPGAVCPERAADVPSTASGGGVDTGTGAVLSAQAGQDFLDLRAAAIRVAGKLNACQAALGRITGQVVSD